MSIGLGITGDVEEEVFEVNLGHFIVLNYLALLEGVAEDLEQLRKKYLVLLKFAVELHLI